MFRDPLVTKFFNVVVEGSSGQLAEEIMLNTCRRIKVNGLFFWRLMFVLGRRSNCRSGSVPMRSGEPTLSSTRKLLLIELLRC